MEKKLLKLAIVLIVISFTGCKKENEINEPSEIGHKVFAILKNFDNTSKKEFKEYFPQIEELRTLGEKIDSEESMKNKLTSLSKIKYQSDIESIYDKIKKDLDKYKINLNKITYSDFTYKSETKGNFTVIEGILYFETEDDTFRLESVSFGLEGEYKLVHLDDMY